MRWLIFVLVAATLAGCTDDPAPEPEPQAEPKPLPANVDFSDSGTMQDGMVITFPFEVDPRAVLVKAEVTVIPLADTVLLTNDMAASLMHNGSIVASGGNQGVSTAFGNGGATEVFFYEQRIPFNGTLAKFSGNWELRFSASGPQAADYAVSVDVRY